MRKSYPLYDSPLLKAQARVEGDKAWGIKVLVDAHGPLACLPLIQSALQMFDGQIAACADSEKLCLSTWIPPIPSRAFSRLADSRLQALLGLVGGACRWGSGTAGDTLYCFIPSKEGTDPAAAYTYSDGEILAGEYGDAFAWPTRVRVIGTGVTYEKQSYTSALAAGMEFFGLLNNANWTTAAQCEVAADAMLDDATARQKGGWIETLPNLGLELFDVIALTDSLAGAALTSVRRRVNGLVTRYEPGRARWLQRVKLERG